MYGCVVPSAAKRSGQYLQSLLLGLGLSAPDVLHVMEHTETAEWLVQLKREAALHKVTHARPSLRFPPASERHGFRVRTRVLRSADQNQSGSFVRIAGACVGGDCTRRRQAPSLAQGSAL